MRKINLVGLALFAVLAFSAFAAASASAASGPEWIVVLCELSPGENTGLWAENMPITEKGKCLGLDGTKKSPWETKLMKLVTNETEPFTSEGGSFILDSATANIECLKEEDTGELIGGNPGTDLSTIEFLECAVQGNRTCLAGNVNAETILVEVKSALVYPHAKAGELAEALDAFFPDNNVATSNEFVEFTLTGGVGPCGLLNNVKARVFATGTTVTDPVSINKKCGVLAVVGRLNSNNVFVKAMSGEEAVTGALESKGTPTLAEIWKTSAKLFELIECKLEAFGGPAEELGTADVTLESREEYGWEDGT